MAFLIRNLSTLAYAQGFTMWHYRTDEPLADVSGPGYFPAGADLLSRGDLIVVSAGDGTHLMTAVRADPTDDGTGAETHALVPLG